VVVVVGWWAPDKTRLNRVLCDGTFRALIRGEDSELALELFGRYDNELALLAGHHMDRMTRVPTLSVSGAARRSASPVTHSAKKGGLLGARRRAIWGDVETSREG
jgi:hypothetical protein